VECTPTAAARCLQFCDGARDSVRWVGLGGNGLGVSGCYPRGCCLGRSRLEGDARPVADSGSAEGVDDGTELAAAPQEPTHAVSIRPEVERCGLVDRRTVDPAFADAIGIDPKAREVVKRCCSGRHSVTDDVHVSVGSQNLNFGDGQGGQEVGQATDTDGAQPRAERDAAAGPRGDGTRIEDFAWRPRVRAGSAGVRNKVVATDHVIPRPPTGLVDLAVVSHRRRAETLGLAPFDGQSPLMGIGLGRLCGGGRHDVGDGLPVAHQVHDSTLGSTLDGLSKPLGIIS
jgi:hypothetical protein